MVMMNESWRKGDLQLYYYCKSFKLESDDGDEDFGVWGLGLCLWLLKSV